MREHDLSIVIVSWNTRDLLRQCLRSVFQNAGSLKLQVLVVDNASSDESAAMVRREFPNVQVTENISNVGFARANNQVLPDCLSELVLLLNPDTVVQDHALEQLVHFIHQHPKAGAVGPKLLHPRLDLRVLGCGNQPTLWRIFTHYSFLSSLLPTFRAFEGIHLFVGIHDRHVREVEWISGACLLTRKSALIDAGGLCEDWFMYAEDWELCARLRRAGWKMYQVPSATVEHHLSASTEQNEAVSTMAITAGRNYFVKLNHPARITLFVFDVVRTMGLGARAIAYFFRGVIDSHEKREMWFGRSRAFGAYSVAALPWKYPDRAVYSS